VAQDIQSAPCSSVEYIHYPVITPTYNDFPIFTKRDLSRKSLVRLSCWIIANKGAAIQLVEVEAIVDVVHDELVSYVVDGRVASVLCQFILRTAATLLTLRFRLPAWTGPCHLCHAAHV
jgi:hypothetical protein